MLRKLFALIILSILLSACAGPSQLTEEPVAPIPSEEPKQTEAPAQTEPAQLPNPASQNCVEQGGTLEIKERGDGGQYGICYFEDNRQCEEWALMRGECPVGGLKITGYITDAAQYCAITGGTYAITGNSEQEDEQGTCTLPNGVVCDVWDTWNGVCTSESGAAGWQTYTNTQAGYSIQAPPTWSQQTLPGQNEGAIQGAFYTGPEGGVEVYWGTGFGGGCPAGTEPVQLAVGEVPACHAHQSDGTEAWNQINYQVEGGNSFSSRAYTRDAQQSSHDLVLQVLSTLAFTTPMPSGITIQPLTMEVCDGQAQAMSHTLDDLVPTQSEEPLYDWVNDISGTGCQATITGNGAQFESPTAVVDELGVMLEEEGWTADPLLVADGPSGTSKGYRKGDQICLASAVWQPDESANCPTDQPVSACPVTPEQQLYTMTLNCGEEAPQSETAPNAGKLVFDSTRGGDYRDLYLMDSAGYNLSRLTHGEANSFAGPWSPDGLRIVYTAYALTNSVIAVINADGSGSAILDQVENSDEGFPAWSPDGQRIAFTSRRDGNNEIYVMNADGSNPVRLTDSPGDDFAPSWSPDGSRIAFASDRDQAQGINDIFIMNADGSAVTHLTNDQANDYAPVWSPDGAQIAFRSDERGQSDIYLINVDGSGRINLTNSDSNEWSPVWSPDGTRIAFQTDRDGNWEIYMMSADGSGPVNLTNDPSDDQLPFWRP